MKQTEYIRRILLVGIACIPVFSGCLHDAGITPPDTDRQVTFSISIPGNSAAGTRALGNDEESEVKTIEMLLFDPATHTVVGNPVFADDISTAPGNVRQKTFSVRLPEGTFDVMIFANARKAFADAGTIAPGDGQEATLARLTASMPASGWSANPADANKKYLIPMWGMKNALTVGQGAAGISGIYLHRMVARIDLVVAGDDEFTGDFKLKDIKLYNVQTEGRIAPVSANWNAAGMINGTTPAGLATAPSTVTGCGVHPAISYAAAIDNITEKECTGSMYLFEAPKATMHADPNAPFMTVKGSFNGIEGWYRIDLADYSDMTYIDVLRNHRYSILIKRVSGTGFPNEDDAIANRGDNIVVDITMWNEYSLGGTVFDGQHFLSLSPQDMEFSVYAHSNASVTIKTDENEDEDLEIDSSDIIVSGSPTDPSTALSGDWIDNPSLSWSGVVNGNNVYTLTFDVAENNTGAVRAGYIYVKYGRLTNVVRIQQMSIDIADVTSINITGSDVVPAVGGQSGTIELTGIPAELAGQMYLNMACATLSGSSLSDGHKLVHHAAQLIDQNGNVYDPNTHYAVNTQFHVRFPKLYWPNREIPDISAVVTFTLSDGTTKACTIRQASLMPKAMQAHNNRNGSTGWGNIINWDSYCVGLINALNAIPDFNVTGEYTAINTNKPIPAGTNYLHTTLNGDSRLTPEGKHSWDRVNTWRENVDGLCVLASQNIDGTPLLNYADSPLKAAGYPDAIYGDLGATTGVVHKIYEPSSTRKVYQYIMEHAVNVLSAADVSLWYGDGILSSMPIADIPASGVVMISHPNNNRTTLVIDPENHFIYMGEMSHFEVGQMTGNRLEFTQNLVKYMENVTRYGTHFTDLLIEDGRPNAQPAPWDSYWGANAIH